MDANQYERLHDDVRRIADNLEDFKSSHIPLHIEFERRVGSLEGEMKSLSYIKEKLDNLTTSQTEIMLTLQSHGQMHLANHEQLVYHIKRSDQNEELLKILRAEVKIKTDDLEEKAKILQAELEKTFHPKKVLKSVYTYAKYIAAISTVIAGMAEIFRHFFVK